MDFWGQNRAELLGILAILVTLVVLGACGKEPPPLEIPQPVRTARGNVKINQKDKILEPSIGAYPSIFEGVWTSGCYTSEDRNFGAVKVELNFTKDVLQMTRKYFSKEDNHRKCSGSEKLKKTIYERLVEVKLIEEGRYYVLFSRDEKTYHKTYDIFVEGLLLNLDEGMKFEKMK